jgi:ribosome-associated toxin RatA of RatAB toxin-antitoxin module
MKTVRKSVLIWYSAQEMFDLVTDVERYPQFLPSCGHARVVSRDAQGMVAEIGIALMGVRQTFTTRNEHIPASPTGVLEEHLHLVNGPFSTLEGRWQFTPVGDGQRACRIELTLDYGFSSGLLSRLIGPVFDKIAASLVDACVRRADQVYGGGATA